MNIFRNQDLARRGFTLVELMIVVAVIGVLAAIGGVSYVKYVKSAKITKLKQYAMEVATAQEQYKSQNANYLDLANKTYKKGVNSTDQKVWENLLGFSKPALFEQDIEVDTIAGAPAGEGSSGVTCSICEGVTPSGRTIWYAVRVTQKLGTSADKRTTVIMHSESETPMVLNEGE